MPGRKGLGLGIETFLVSSYLLTVGHGIRLLVSTTAVEVWGR